MRWIAATAAYLLVTAQACAQPLIPGLGADQIDTAMERAAASLGAAVAIYSMDCQMGAKYACTYQAAGPFQIVATAPDEGSDVDSISVVWLKRTDTDALTTYLGLMIMVAEPKMARRKQGEVLLGLINGAADALASVEGDNALFSAVDWPQQGLWFTAASKDR